MAQKQCPWCGRLGAHYDEADWPVGGMGRRPPAGGEYDPHADGSACVCRHVGDGETARASAASAGGRYYDRQARKWLCFGCGTAMITRDDVVAAIDAAGWSVTDGYAPDVRIVNAAPDSSDYPGGTEPGSEWDEECDDILATIREAVEPLGWGAQWSDNDIVVEPDKSVR